VLHNGDALRSLIKRRIISCDFVAGTRAVIASRVADLDVSFDSVHGKFLLMFEIFQLGRRTREPGIKLIDLR
jgi:hypothetical protein